MDGCDNTATTSQPICFPTRRSSHLITVTASTPVNCNPTSSDIAAAFGTATVSDNCSTELSGSFTDGPETGTGCTHSVTRNWTATDGCGNTATTSQTISFTRDTQAPT